MCVVAFDLQKIRETDFKSTTPLHVSRTLINEATEGLYCLWYKLPL